MRRRALLELCAGLLLIACVVSSVQTSKATDGGKTVGQAPRLPGGRKLMSNSTAATGAPPEEKFSFVPTLEAAAQNKAKLRKALASKKSKRCVYGRYGGACKGQPRGSQVPLVDAPLDVLDQAFFWHDKCFEGLNARTCANCQCNLNLADTAKLVWGGKDTAPNDTQQLAAMNVWAAFKTPGRCEKLCTGGEKPPPAVGTCSALIAYDYRLSGGKKLGKVNVTDWAACCAKCNTTDGCRAWVYRNQTCEMKGPGCAKGRPANNTISGFWDSSSVGGEGGGSGPTCHPSLRLPRFGAGFARPIGRIPAASFGGGQSSPVGGVPSASSGQRPRPGLADAVDAGMDAIEDGADLFDDGDDSQSSADSADRDGSDTTQGSPVDTGSTDAGAGVDTQAPAPAPGFPEVSEVAGAPDLAMAPDIFEGTPSVTIATSDVSTPTATSPTAESTTEADLGDSVTTPSTTLDAGEDDWGSTTTDTGVNV